MAQEGSIDYFDQLKQVAPTRDISLPDIDMLEDDIPQRGGSNSSSRPRSATDALSLHKLTDMQTALHYLNPDLGEDLNHIVYGRTFPDIYHAYSRMLVKDLIFKTRGDFNVSVVSLMAKVNTVLSKSIDGEAIIDLLTLVGARRAEDEKEKASLMGL